MLETPHVIVAAAIASKIPNPTIALPLAFASHFIFEKIPHWNPHINAEKKKYGGITRNSMLVIITDSALSLFAGTYIASLSLPDTNHFFTIMAACFVGVLPDLIEAPYYIFNKKSAFVTQKWIPFKKSIQVDATAIPGILSQIVVIIGAIWVILK